MGGVLAGTAALLPLDQAITEEFRDPGPQGSALLHHAANYVNVAGSPGVLVASASLYAIGRVSHQGRLARLGLYGTEAIAVSGAVTALIKGIVGRGRPYLDENDPDGFGLNRGFRDGKDTSFPSGHATAAFAAAAVVAGESKRWWPHAARYVVPAAYGGATLVALARVYSDKHWASDVVMGAGIGTLSGLAIVHFNQAHPHNAINRWLLGASLLPDRTGGMLLAWTIRTR
jgi:membrane-associated phospholipid phosphatase